MGSLGIDFSARVKRGTAATNVFCRRIRAQGSNGRPLAPAPNWRLPAAGSCRIASNFQVFLSALPRKSSVFDKKRSAAPPSSTSAGCGWGKMCVKSRSTMDGRLKIKLADQFSFDDLARVNCRKQSDATSQNGEKVAAAFMVLPEGLLVFRKRPSRLTR